eukprot:GEMP01080641.1.p1 GENE.GEMP01080641.1~~GEMP01080641.1.p1  ORF type:complete len:174 (+),score=55.92 GEMP01080641.1:71-592(+)
MGFLAEIFQSEVAASVELKCSPNGLEAARNYRQQLAARGKTTVAASAAVSKTASTVEGASASSASDSDAFASVQRTPAAGRLYHQQLFGRGQALLERIGGLPALIQTSIPTTTPTTSAQTPAKAWLEQATLELSNDCPATSDAPEQRSEDEIAYDVESDDEIIFEGFAIGLKN